MFDDDEIHGIKYFSEAKPVRHGTYYAHRYAMMHYVILRELESNDMIQMYRHHDALRRIVWVCTHESITRIRKSMLPLAVVSPTRGKQTT